ncbi:MAG: HEAT repeat domain-containing protein [Planctomycetota bacterium]
MKKHLLLGAFVAAGAFCLPDVSFGHGGTYRGPGDTVPPGGGGGGGGGGGPSTPGPSGPSAPGPSGPSSPGPSSPGAPGAGPSSSGPTTGGGGNIGPDLSIWDFWWGFNKEPYLNLRQKVRSSGVQSTSDDFFLGRGQADQAKDTFRPSEDMIRNEVVPALKRVLEKERQNDIITGALIALAKIGESKDADGTSEFADIFRKFLNNGEQEIAETATLALGILADDRAVPTLVSLMRDDPEGRKLIGKEINYRTRAFAAYGLGLVGYRTSDNAVRQTIVEHLLDILEAPRFAQPDIKLGALGALGLIPLDWEGEAAAEEATGNAATAANRVAVLDYLHMRMNPDTRVEGFKDFRVRAHAAIAAARLVSTHESEVPAAHLASRDKIVERLLEIADKNSKEERVEVLQSSVIALGMVGNASKQEGVVKTNEEIFENLKRIAKTAADNQTEFFALIALGEMGSRPGPGESKAERRGLQTACQKELLSALAKGKGQKKPWAALAIGVYGNALLENDGDLEPAVVAAVREACRKGDRPDESGAYAVSLGLMKDRESEELLLERLEYFAQDEPRGYIAVGLGLMEANSSIEKLNEIIKKSKFRPDLLKQAAIGLGLLGDKQAVPELVEMLRTAKGLSAQAAIASALGTIGDANSVKPLVEMLGDTGITDTARGFAAVALGITCDKEDFPWNTKIARNTNYRVNVQTLTTSDGKGILDIL